MFTLGSKTFNSGVLCVDKGDSTKLSLLHHSMPEPMIWDSQVESLFRSRLNDSSSMQNLMELQDCMEKKDVNESARMLEECLRNIFWQGSVRSRAKNGKNTNASKQREREEGFHVISGSTMNAKLTNVG